MSLRRRSGMSDIQIASKGKLNAAATAALVTLPR
jgi:hypothetical protein